MIDYHRAATKASPLVILSRDEQRVEIRGKSIPEASVQFYFPIINRIKEVFSGFGGHIEMNIALEYMNTSSSKCLFDMLKAMKKLPGVQLTVNWHHEVDDEDMIETGEDFEDVTGLTFVYVPVENVEEGIYY